MKQKFIEAHMSVAETYANLSSATRLKVGCVIVKNDTIIGIGYNGMPSGWTNECEEYRLTESSDGTPMADVPENYYSVTKPEVIHAEINAIAKVARSTNSTEGAVMFVTHAPCIECAKIIHQSGINSVFYRNAYRQTNGVEFLKKSGVSVQKCLKLIQVK